MGDQSILLTKLLKITQEKLLWHGCTKAIYGEEDEFVNKQCVTSRMETTRLCCINQFVLKMGPEYKEEQPTWYYIWYTF